LRVRKQSDEHALLDQESWSFDRRFRLLMAASPAAV
jgi:hypothetical protein